MEKEEVLERFGSQHSQSGSQALVTPVLVDLKSSFDVQWFLHVCNALTYTYIRASSHHIR